MNTGIISNRYAKALYAYALEEHSEDKVYSEMQILNRSFMEVRRLRFVMVSPVLSAKDKASLIYTAAGGDVSDPFKRFVRLVLKENRESFFHFMANSYIEVYRQEKNINIGRLITVLPVDDLVLKRLKKFISDRAVGSVEFQSKVDPSLIGGFILDIDTYRIDASVSTQLNAIRREYERKNTKLV